MENIGIIITVLSAGIMILWFKSEWGYKRFKALIDKNPCGDYPQPQIAASIGVLGTFFGICIGLYIFDSKDIENSVPLLLDGMKTAFVTSILGMIMSLYMKYQQEKAKKNIAEDSVDEDAAIGDLIAYLKHEKGQEKVYRQTVMNIMQDNNKILANTITTSMEKMTDSLVGDGESTLIGQLKIMRSDMHADSRELISEFREFAETMAKNNTETFIKALSEAMNEFNKNLAEQFGENFKQLNIAVGKLLDWQENYRKIIIEVTENQRIIFAGIQEVNVALEKIATSSEGVVIAADKLSNIIVTASEFELRLKEALTELEDVGSKARNAVPQIQELVHTSTEGIQSISETGLSSLKENVESMQISIAEASTTSVNVINASLNDIKEGITASMADIATIVSKTTDESVDKMESYSQSLVEQLSDINRKNASYLEDSADKLRNYIEKTIGENNATLKEAMLEVVSGINQITESLNNKTKELQSEVDAIISGIGESTEELLSALKDDTERVTDSSEEQLVAIKKSEKAVIEEISNVLEALKRDTKNVTDRTTEIVENLINNHQLTLEAMTKQWTGIVDKSMEDSLKNIGNTMAAIADRLAEKYEPFVQAVEYLGNHVANINRGGR